MKIIIPFIYETSDFQLDTVNQGIVLVKRLGHKPVSIILGKKETEQIKGWYFSGKPPGPLTEIFGLKLKHNQLDSYLGFQCEYN